MDPAHVTPRVKSYMHTSFRFVAPGVFLEKIPFLVYLHYHGNHFRGGGFVFLPNFKLGQNLSSCQVSEKSTHRFGQNDGIDRQTYRQTDVQTDRRTDRQTYRQTDKFHFFPRHATWHKTISGWVSSISKSLVKI